MPTCTFSCEAFSFSTFSSRAACSLVHLSSAACCSPLVSWSSECSASSLSALSLDWVCSDFCREETFSWRLACEQRWAHDQKSITQTEKKTLCFPHPLFQSGYCRVCPQPPLAGDTVVFKITVTNQNLNSRAALELTQHKPQCDLTERLTLMVKKWNTATHGAVTAMSNSSYKTGS